MIKLSEGKITFLVGQDRTTIEINDGINNVLIAEITLSNDQLASMLSRLVRTDCTINFNEDAHLYVNKEKVIDRLQVEVTNVPYNERNEVAIKLAKREMVNRPGWHLLEYLGSKNSFVTERNSGKEFANFTIYTYV